MWMELLFKGHQVFKSITSSWNRGSGTRSLRQTLSHSHSFPAPVSKGRSGHWPCLRTYIPVRSRAGGKCRWQSLLRLRIFTFSSFLSNSLNGMKQCADTPVPRCLRGYRAGCQNSNFCHCNQQITAFYGYHTFLTLQCLCNVELIHRISTQSRKLHDSFGSLHN